MSSKRRNFRLTFAISALLLMAVAFFLISVLGNLRGARVDMTSDRLFTMSPAAADILSSLQVPVQVKLYITPTDKMPTQLRNLERDITEQLRNFQQVSNDMLEFAVFNPQDDADMQQNLASKGIQPFQVQSVDKDEIGVKRIWSAITIAYKDKPEEALPQVLPQNLMGLEQDIIGLIHRLTRERAPKIAIFTPKKDIDQQTAMMYLQQGMQPPEPQDQYTRLADLMQQGHYESVKIDLTADSPVPEDADLLVVMATRPLNERQIYEINRTLVRGVPVVMGVQAHEYGYRPRPQGGWEVGGQDVATGLDPLLDALGLTVGEDHFMDASMEVIELPREVNLGGLRMQSREPVRLPMQIRVTESQMDQDSPLVNRIGSIFYLWGTPVTTDIQAVESLGLAATDLIFSSDNCWSETFMPGPLAESQMSPQGKTMLGAQPLAVLVEGLFPDTWAGREVPAWPTAPGTEADPLAAGPDAVAPVDPKPSQLVVIGSAKMFDDNVIAAPQNALLLLNAVDYLAGNQDLLTIRSKILTNRVIKPVDATAKLMWRLFVVLLVPVALTIYGISRATLRRKAAAAYRRDISRKLGTNR